MEISLTGRRTLYFSSTDTILALSPLEENRKKGNMEDLNIHNETPT